MTAIERDLLIRDVTDSIDEMTEKVATACVDPTLRDTQNAGIFFAAAQIALTGLKSEEADEFQAYLTQFASGR